MTLMRYARLFGRDIARGLTDALFFTMLFFVAFAIGLNLHGLVSFLPLILVFFLLALSIGSDKRARAATMETAGD